MSPVVFHFSSSEKRKFDIHLELIDSKSWFNISENTFTSGEKYPAGCPEESTVLLERRKEEEQKKRKKEKKKKRKKEKKKRKISNTFNMKKRRLLNHHT